MIWVNVAKKYLAAYASKNIELLEEMYASRVELCCWDCHFIGKEEVLAGNRRFFEVADHINIRIQNTCYKHKQIFVEFTKTWGSNKILQIVEIIEFDDFGKIKAIRSYRQ